MKQLMEECLEFLLKTVGGVFILSILIVLVFLAVFWPQAEREPLPWLGIVGRDLDAETVQQFRLPFNRGVFVEKVFPNSPADYSNLAPGDFVVKFNDRILFNEAQLRDQIFNMDPQEKAWMTVYRDGVYYNVELRLAARPTDNSVPAQAAALAMAPQGGGQQALQAAPPITSDAPLRHAYRGVCSNCHVIVSKSRASQPNTQLVAALSPGLGLGGGPAAGFQGNPAAQTFVGGARARSLPGQNLPGSTQAVPLEEFTWAGMGLETFNPANAGALGLPPNATGVQVDDVLLGSRADRGGLLAGDLIREINGFSVYDVNSFANVVTAQGLTGGVLLINRSGRAMHVTIPER